MANTVQAKYVPGTKVEDLTGQTFGAWTVLSFSGKRPCGKQLVTFWLCRCSCGTVQDVRGAALKTGGSLSCGLKGKEHRPSRLVDLAGQRFGRFTVLSLAEKMVCGQQEVTMWRCRCDCGTIKDVRASSLNNGVTGSCGCLNDELIGTRSRTHGRSKTPIYTVWQNMRHRCEDTNDVNYPAYGGRGIRVCSRWRDSFAAFLADMGERPVGYTLERIDPNGHYYPENCTWATPAAQAQNRRSTRFVTFKGETLCASEWARRVGMPASRLLTRLNLGWSVERALQTPKVEGRGVTPTAPHSTSGRYRHGLTYSAEYRSWCSMKDRCTNPRTPMWHRYGGRGIAVCRRWAESFEAFYEDMGSRPSLGYSLDRKNLDGNYEPGNCRWATKAEQNSNTSRNRFLTYLGKTQTLFQWSREVGLSPLLISHRIKKGWTVERALTTPVMQGPKK